MADIAVSVACEVAKCLVAPVRRHCGYVIFSDRYVRQLKDELAKLDEVRGGVQRSISDAENDMREIRRDVNRWKNEADNSANKAHGVLDDEGRAKKTCFCGWLPNPKERYCRGRGARKTAQAIQDIQARIPQGTFEGVYLESAPPGLIGGAPNVNSSACDGGDTIQELIAGGQIENPPPGRAGDDEGDAIQELIARGQIENPPPERVGDALDVNSLAGDGGDFITGSRASIFRDIMKALHDEKHEVIGVYGPGGVGKTTLLEIVEEKLKKEETPFQMIAKSKVSQTPDWTKVQRDIAYFLGLRRLKSEPSDAGRKDLLFKRLQKDPSEKVLIILDDLWEEFDLRAVGISLGDKSKGCKLLLTSRFKNVLEQMKCDTPIFHLEGLKDDEAFRLFEKTVADRLKDNEGLKSIADQVVKKLAGLPLLINSVASTLKSSNESAWRNALIELDDSNKIKKETIVKLSYGHLKSEDAKYLFLLSGLIGGTIPVELLLVLVMGLGLFQRFNKTMPDLRDRLNNMLEELRSTCLLLEGGDDKDNVNIHDLYSEVVVSTPFQDQNSLMMNNNYGASSKEELEKCWAICLDDAGINRLAELMPCQFPSLKILILSMPEVWYRKQEYAVQRRLELPDFKDMKELLPDFKDMKELRVLCLRFMHITNLPPSIEILENLRSLYLYNCKVEDVAIISKLKALQSLSFTRSTISRLPEEMGELTNLIQLLANSKHCRVSASQGPQFLGYLKKWGNLQI